MTKPFDMDLFLAGILSGSKTTRARHVRQAQAIQVAISERWHRDNPWTWQQKHFIWFVNQHLNKHSRSTRYYYLLTMELLTLRLGKSWQLKVQAKASVHIKHRVDYAPGRNTP
ncbi:hypothetical protein [Pseudomonas proteolytica]|jgi:hypothetical protein|uniref:hypothetical protein n=1 Tax=Pseudomonas proteolytica TaxID=219574 RepID=UPI00147317B5|nr:hypothetical protein [Pseudomonas proteolytica]NMZ32591.1 hypothetical protein [Pseudomonas proteolytica]UQS91024.1 hypothetical protein M5C90_06380 [Pseudomonas chlororaphis subsp. piscium]